VRELQNRVKRAIIMADGPMITPEDLDLDGGDGGQADNGLNLRACRERAERTVLLRALARSDGNLSQAARLIGVSRPTLYDLLRHHGLRADVADAAAANGAAQAPG
jgi:two-component system, NtrC family, response regulator